MIAATVLEITIDTQRRRYAADAASTAPIT